jgi:hypothetical protein
LKYVQSDPYEVGTNTNHLAGISRWYGRLAASSQCLASILESTSWRLDSTSHNRDGEEEAETSNIAPNHEHTEFAWIEQAYVFLVAVVLWFDILSYLSTSQKPRLDHNARFSNHALDMSLVMGCQNWVLEEIGNLAYLDGWKMQAVHSRTLSMSQLVTRG